MHFYCQQCVSLRIFILRNCTVVHTCVPVNCTQLKTFLFSRAYRTSSQHLCDSLAVKLVCMNTNLLTYLRKKWHKMYAYNGINTHLVPYIYSSVQFSKRDASVYRHIYMCWDS